MNMLIVQPHCLVCEIYLIRCKVIKTGSIIFYWPQKVRKSVVDGVFYGGRKLSKDNLNIVVAQENYGGLEKKKKKQNFFFMDNFSLYPVLYSQVWMYNPSVPAQKRLTSN
jgi:hypothetical protein